MTERTLQSGSMPSGVTAAGFRVPMNTPNLSYDYVGATVPVYELPLIEINDDYTLMLSGNWENYVSQKIRSGSRLQLKRGNIQDAFVVKNLKVLNEDSSPKTLVKLNSSSASLVSYVGSTGFPNPSSETSLTIGNLLESSVSYEDLIKNLTVKQTIVLPLNFTAKISWENSYQASAVQIRWRSVPRFTPKESGMSTPDPFNQTGSVDYVRVLSVGDNYTQNSQIVFSGGGGTGASAYLVIVENKIVDVNMISGGEGYTSAPNVTVVDSTGTGATLRSNVDYISQWNYEPAVYNDSNILISDLKISVPYEFQILVSSNLDFTGKLKYSDSYRLGS